MQITRRTAAALLGLVLAITVVSYAPVWSVGLVYEDTNVIQKMHEPGASFPNRWLTFATFRATGIEPVVAHGVTLGLHLLNGLLLYRLLRCYWRRGFAVLGCAVFLWHPLATEAVIAFNGRADVLLTTGWLLAAIGMLRTGWLAPVLTVLGLALACVSKELGLAGVAVVGLLALSSRRRRAVWCGLGVVGLLVLAWPSIRVWLWITDQFGLASFAWLQVKAVAVLAGLAVYPVGLSIDHDPRIVSVSAGMLVLSGAALLLAWALWRRGVVALAVTWIAACLLPRFVIFGVETVSEHQVYPALVGVSVLLVLGGARVADALVAYVNFCQYRPVTGWTVLEVDR